jgi:CheY-like chemotaxis protein
MAVEQKSNVRGASGGPPGMLVVYTDAAIRCMMGEVLDLEGYAPILLAADGAEAVQLVRVSTQPLLVLLGSILPALSGREVLAAIEAEPLLARYHALLLLGTDWEWRQPKWLPHPPWPMVGLPFQLPALLDAVERSVCQLEARRTRPRPRGKLFD